MTTDLNMDRFSLKQWSFQNGESNRDDLDRAKQLLPVILTEVLTEKQRDYILKYFSDGMNIVQIAELYGVDRSTVSRTINRGLEKAFQHLRFVGPSFANATFNRVNLRRRKPKRRTRK